MLKIQKTAENPIIGIENLNIGPYSSNYWHVVQVGDM